MGHDTRIERREKIIEFIRSSWVNGKTWERGRTGWYDKNTLYLKDPWSFLSPFRTRRISAMVNVTWFSVSIFCNDQGLSDFFSKMSESVTERFCDVRINIRYY